MNRGCVIQAPEGFQTLKKGVDYYYLASQPNRVLLIEFREQKKIKRSGKEGKYQAVSHTWVARLTAISRAKFESGLTEERLVDSGPRAYPPWLTGSAPKSRPKGAPPMKFSHAKRVEKKFVILGPLLPRIEEILRADHVDKELNAHACRCEPEQNAARVRLWFYTYAIFRTSESLSYPTGNMGRWDRTKDGAKRGRPSINGKTGHNATALKDEILDSYLRHSQLGKPMTEVHRDALLDDFGCKTRPGISQGTREVYHPHGDAYPSIGQYRRIVNDEFGPAKVLEDIRGARMLREDYLPSQGPFCEGVMNLMSQTQSDAYQCKERPKGCVTRDPQPPLYVVRQICVASGIIAGVGFSMGSEQGVAYRVANFCAAIRKSKWGRIVGVEISDDAWPSQGVSAEDITDRGPGVSRRADARGDANKASKTMVPSRQPRSKANIESANPKSPKHREEVVFVSKLTAQEMMKKEVLRAVRENQSKNVAKHVPPELLKDVVRTTPNNLWKAMDARGRNSSISIPFESAVRMYLPSAPAQFREDGLYVFGQRYDSDELRLFRSRQIWRSRRQIDAEVFHLPMAMRYVWFELEGHLLEVEIHLPLQAGTAQKYVSLTDLQQRAQLLKTNDADLRENRVAAAMDDEAEVRRQAGIKSTTATRRPGRHSRRRTGYLPPGFRSGK